MNTISLTGEDVIQVVDPSSGGIRNVADMADGDSVVLAFNNDKATVKVGKNGNTIYAKNAMGELVDVSIRLLRGSADDKFFNSRMAEQDADFSAFIPLVMNFVKRTGDGKGNVGSDVYPMVGGVFKKNVDTKTTAEGDAEQSVSVYNLQLKLSPNRNIQ